MSPKPDSSADAMNAWVRTALQRRRGAPPVDPPEADPAETAPPRVPSVDAGVTLSPRPAPDMNALIRRRLGRA